MIPVPSGVRVWLAVGHTDMRRGMNSLALQVQERLERDPHAGDLYVFCGKRGHLIASRRDRRDQCGATGLYARRHRLAEPGSHLASSGGWLRAATH
jgi:IS66 Orf2 like protein